MNKQTLETLLARKAPGMFQTIIPLLQQGSMRAVFEAQMGSEQKPVILKVDKIPANEYAKMLQDAGCTTQREIETHNVLPIDEALAHHVSPIIAHYHDEGIDVAVEVKFQGAKSVAQMLNERTTEKTKGTLTTKEFDAVFGQFIGAVQYIDGKGIFHRDLNLSNVLVGDKLEVRLTDFANAKRHGHVSPDFEPTAGARHIKDPLLGSRFTGRLSEYNPQAEMYALGIDALIALTGESPVSYDHTTGKAINTYAGENILDSNGRIEKAKHAKAIQQGIAKISKQSRKHAKWIAKATSIDEKQRYESLDALAHDFHEAARPGVIRRHARPLIAAGGTALLVLAGAIGVAYNVNQRTIEESASKIAQVLKENEKFKVVTSWNGETFELENNAFSLQVRAYNSSKKVHHTEIKYFPTIQYLEANQGDTIQLYVKSREAVRERRVSWSTGSFSGLAYIEGLQVPMKEDRSHDGKITTYPAGKFNTYPYPTDEAKLQNSEGGYYGGDVQVVIPQGTPDGLYHIIVEVYGDDEEKTKKYPSNHDDIIVPKPGYGLARIPVPVIVGNPAYAYDLSFLQLEPWQQSFSVRDIRGTTSPLYDTSANLRDKVFYEIHIPEDNFTLTHQGYVYGMNLPVPQQGEQKTLELNARDADGNLLTYQAFPINVQATDIRDKNPRLTWKIGDIDPQFAYRIAEYRKAAEQRRPQLTGK